jgi:hypothetical protein
LLTLQMIFEVELVRKMLADINRPWCLFFDAVCVVCVCVCARARTRVCPSCTYIFAIDYILVTTISVLSTPSHGMDVM